jgi:amidase
MSVLEIKSEQYQYVFSPYSKPIARVKPGDRIIVHTNDAFESRIRTEEDLPSKALATAKFLNPQTGPIYVDGAEPGDTLSVLIESIEPTRDFAVSCFIDYFGGLTSTPFTRSLHDPLPEKTWIWRLQEDSRGKYFFNDELRVRVPWDPFMGTFGVALEITAKVTLIFGVIKEKKIEWPRIESNQAIMVCGSAKPMEDAARIACAELILWIQELGFSRWEAYELLTQVGGLYVGNMVDTAYTLVASIQKNYLKRQ